MSRILLAFRAFFAVLINARVAELVAQALAKQTPAPPERVPPKEPVLQPQVKKTPARNDAVNLLATLQRESRLVDFLKEPIDAYTDAQIGSAVRGIHRDCAAAIDRIFGLKPIETSNEGAEIELSKGFDPARFRLVGRVVGEPPFRGNLRHPGWEAIRCEMPEWTGTERCMLVVAPAEVELK